MDFDVPNEMVLHYCKIILALESKFDANLEQRRAELHDKIFEHVGCHRSLYRKIDRDFSKALNNLVADMTYKE